MSIGSQLRHRIRSTSLALALAVTPAAGSVPVAAAAVEPPTVVFQVGSSTGRSAAERCAEIWAREGPRLTTELLPGGPEALTAVDTVFCLVLDSELFNRRFGASLPDWGVGVALPGGRVVAIDHARLPAVGRGLREIFLHEMVHALLFQGSAGSWLPAWFHEGAAMHYAGEWRFVDTVSLVLEGRVPELDHLQGRFPIVAARADRAYRTSLLAVRRLRDRHDPGIVAAIVAATRRQGDFDAGFLAATGETPEDFSRRFAADMRLRFGWLVMLTRWPTLFVLLALILAAGAVRRLVVTRRRLAEMDDPPLD